MVGVKRKSEVSLCENVAITNEPITPTKKKRKKMNDAFNPEMCTGNEDRHSGKKTKLKRTLESEGNNTRKLLNGEDLPKSSRKFPSSKTGVEPSSEDVPVLNGIGQSPEKHNKIKKRKKETVALQKDIAKNGETIKKKRHVTFTLEKGVTEKIGKAAFVNPTKLRKRKNVPAMTMEDVPEEESVEVQPVLEPFSAKDFRESLKSKEGGIQALKDFVSYIVRPRKNEDMGDVIKEYMEAGGNAMEILQQLETKEQETLGVASAVFTALHAIIMRSLTDMPDYRASCEEASRYLLNAYLPTIQKMLSEKASIQDIKATLKLLTGVVSINSVFAKDVLANVKFPAPILRIVTKPVMLGEKSSVRTFFMHYLLAFLVDQNVSTIRSFLEKPGLLMSILPGMVFDPAETVHLALTALRTNVAENKNISKTLKRNVFNTNAMKLLLRVYTWRGPQRGFKKIWGPDEEQVDPEGRGIATGALHQLMLVLCTSHKLGIVFVDRSVGTSRRNANELMHSVLKHIQRPWEKDRTRDLVLGVLKACPDLLRGLINSMLPDIEPRPSEPWLRAMGFLKQVVEAWDPEVCLRPHLQVVPREQLASVVQVLCAPPPVVKVMNQRMLLHSGLVVRQTAMQLLVAMYEQAQRFLTAMEAWGVAEVDKLRARVTKYLPKIDMLLQVWNEPPVSAHGGISKVESPILNIDLASHLSTLLDLMLLQHHACPATMEEKPKSKKLKGDKEETPPAKLELWELLGVIEQVGDPVEMAVMQVKAVQVIFEVDTHWFQNDKKTFSHAIQLLLKLLHHPASRVTRYACSVLISIFEKTGLFDESPGEVGTWIHCYRRLDGGQREAAAKLLARSLMRVARKPAKYIARCAEVKNEKWQRKEKKRKSEKEEEEGNAQSGVAKEGRPSPLLAGIVREVSRGGDTLLVRHLLNRAVVHLSHSPTWSPAMSSLVADSVDPCVVDYARRCDTALSLAALQTLFGRLSPEYRLAAFVLGRPTEYADASQLLEGKKRFKTEVKTEDCSDDVSTPEKTKPMEEEEDVCGETDPVRLSIQFETAAFHAARMISRGELTEMAMSRCCDVFETILCSFGGGSEGERCMRGLLNHPVLLNGFVPFAARGDRRMPTELVTYLARLDCPKDILKPYKDKIVGALLRTLKKKAGKVEGETFAPVGETLSTFEPESEDVVKLLEALSSRPVSSLVEECRLSTWGDLLASLIARAAGDHRPLPSKIVASIANVYAKLRRDNSLDLSPIELGLVAYLESFPHNQAAMPNEVFVSIVKAGSIPESSLRLGKLLLARNQSLGSVLIDAISDGTLQDAASVFELCSVLLGHKSAEKAVNVAYGCHGEDVNRAVKKPHKADRWAVDNAEVVARAIEMCASEETKKGWRDYVEGRVKKLVSRGGFRGPHLHWIESVYVGANDAEWLAILLEAFAMAANKDRESVDGISRSISSLAGWLESPIQRGSNWMGFATGALRLGLSSGEKDRSSALPLDALTSLVSVMYVDGDNHPEALTVFEMTLSHSEFLNVILGDSTRKRSLIALIAVLAAKCPSAMRSEHVPVLLGAYGATLSQSDRALLALIARYEAYGVSTHACRPYLWGEAAVNYYCVKTREAVSLWRQPQTSQVLELLSMETVQNTVRSFPLDRGTDPGLEVAEEPQVYDPAFFLPLFSHLLSPGSVVQPHKFTHTGAMALTLAALASSRPDVRALAYHVLGRYRHHLEASRGRDREWWTRFVEAVGGGVAELGDGGGEGVQLACIVTTFLARASLVISRPLDPMFGPLNRFILAKPAMNLNTIPELYILFNSTDLNSKVHRHFLLEVLRDGLRLPFDWRLAMKCVLFQLLFTYYSSIVSAHDYRSKVMILEVVHTAVKMPDVAKFLVGGYGLLPWLQQVVRDLGPSDHDLVMAAIQVVESLWHSVAVSKVRTQAPGVNKRHFAVNISLILVTLIARLPPTMTPAELGTFISVLLSVSESSMATVVSASHLSSLVTFCEATLGPLGDCERMIEFGCRFVEREKEDSESPSETEMAKRCLRQVIVMWWESKRHEVKLESPSKKRKDTKKKRLASKKTASKSAKSKASKTKKGASKPKAKTGSTDKKAKRKTTKHGKVEKKKQMPAQDANA